MIETRLYFGVSGAASPERFETFQETVIAPALSEGFTVIEAGGYWRSNRLGQTISEPSRIVVRVHDGSASASGALDQIIAAYKSSFDQESVLRTDTQVCGRF